MPEVKRTGFSGGGAVMTEIVNPPNGDFAIGQQPCQHFVPRWEGNAFGTWGNRHECYGRCGRLVSFYEKCNRDHHQNGYESCKPEEDKSNG